MQALRRCSSANSNVQVAKQRQPQGDELRSAVAAGDFGLAVSFLPQGQQAAFQTEFDRRKRNAGVAYALCFLLGALGLHKFYVGKDDWGVVYAVGFLLGFVTLGIAWALLGLAVLIDFLTIPGQVQESNDLIRKGVLMQIANRL